MLKQIVDKRNYFILILIILLIVWLIFNGLTPKKEYIQTFNYFNKNITLKIYNSHKPKTTFQKIEQIFQKYASPSVSTLNELIKYGQKIYQATDGLIDISDQSLVQSLQKGQEINFQSTIDTLNPQSPELNLDDIISSYAVNEVTKYLKGQSYILNIDGDIVAGDHYHKEKYAISLSRNSALIDIIYLQNKAVVTRGQTDEFQSYKVNPLTSQQSPYKHMVVVIAKDINTANFLAQALYLQSQEAGQKFLKNYQAEAIWISENGQQTMTEGFKKYLTKP